MLIRNEVENAVRLQACGYQLLKWLEKALKDGFISPEAAGTYATSEMSSLTQQRAAMVETDCGRFVAGKNGKRV